MEHHTAEVPPQRAHTFEDELALAGLCAYINAGGRGTRLNKLFTPDSKTGITKALLRLNGSDETLLEKHINTLLEEGMDTIVAGVGDHLHALQYVEDRYQDNARVSAIHYANQLGNGGDLVRAVRDYPQYFSDNIYIVNVDTFTRVDKRRVKEQHEANEADLTFILTTSENVPNYQAFYVGTDDRILHTDEDSRLTPPANLAAETMYRASSTGGMVIAKKALQAVDWQPAKGELGLYRDIVGMLVQKGTAFAYNNGHEKFIDVGTVETWNEINRSPSTYITPQKGILA